MSYESHLFWADVKNLRQILKMENKNSEKVFVFEINLSELVALNILYYAENPCHRLSVY